MQALQLKQAVQKLHCYSLKLKEGVGVGALATIP